MLFTGDPAWDLDVWLFRRNVKRTLLSEVLHIFDQGFNELMAATIFGMLQSLYREADICAQSTEQF